MSLIKTENRFTVFPIKYQNLWKFYKQHVGTFWITEEVQLIEDIHDFNEKLNDNERYFLKNILAFFASSDGIVNENLVLNFYNEVQIPEARCFYTIQMLIESIHGEQYSLLIDTYVKDDKEKHKLFNAVENIPVIKEKANWALKWIESGSSIIESIPKETLNAIKLAEKQGIQGLSFFTKERPSFSQRLIAFIFVEGIFFSGSFCAIYWLKNRGLMPGLSKANDFIARDENIHTEFAIELYKTTCEKLDETIVHTICKEAVEIEQKFITESLPVSLIGMNCKFMKQYIEYVADRWLILLGYSKIFNSSNPFVFMELISLENKTNFFEQQNAQYQKANIGHNDEERTISFDSDDF
jgi:ribonucleoside-diphosphate reductase beta chain